MLISEKPADISIATTYLLYVFEKRKGPMFGGAPCGLVPFTKRVRSGEGSAGWQESEQWR